MECDAMFVNNGNACVVFGAMKTMLALFSILQLYHFVSILIATTYICNLYVKGMKSILN